MNLKPVIQSEVSQKEKNKHHISIYIYIYRNLENGTDEPVCSRTRLKRLSSSSSRDVDTENRVVDTMGDGQHGMKGESNFETYKLPYVKQIASGNLLYDAGSFTWGY